MAFDEVNSTQGGGETPRTGNSLAQMLALVRCAQPAHVGELRAKLFPRATQFFGAMRGGLFLLAEMPDDPRTQNPVFRALMERHAPLHEGQVLAPTEWRALQSREDHGHVLVGPLVANGELVGVLGFTRHFNDVPFDERDLSNLSALCLHVSTQMVAPARFDLTPRERQVAALVAKGQTNAGIGRALGVSSETVKAALKVLFRKTNVSSRAELVAVLVRPHPERGTRNGESGREGEMNSTELKGVLPATFWFRLGLT